MGQKVNPHGMRVGVIKDWDSRWYASEEKVGDLIVEDQKIREYLKKTLYGAGVPKIEIERSGEGKVIQGLRRVSKPGLRIYSNCEDMPKVMNGMGIAIVSTSKGIMTDKKARQENVGGEILAFVLF